MERSFAARRLAAQALIAVKCLWPQRFFPMSVDAGRQSIVLWLPEIIQMGAKR